MRIHIGKRCLICKLVVFVVLFVAYMTLGDAFSSLYDVAHGELPCFVDQNVKHSIKYMLFNFDQLMRQYNLTYWADYGTLLGSYRNGKMIRYDQDGDLGYFYKDRAIIDLEIAPILRRRDIIVDNPDKTVQLEYKKVKIDLFAYDTYKNLGKKLPDSKTGKTLTRAYYRNSDFFEQTYSDAEYDWIFPVRTNCPFENMTLMCPRDAERVLATRYPYTFPYGVKLPFKFWCYANPKSFLKVLFSS